MVKPPGYSLAVSLFLFTFARSEHGISHSNNCFCLLCDSAFRGHVCNGHVGQASCPISQFGVDYGHILRHSVRSGSVWRSRGCRSSGHSESLHDAYARGWGILAEYLFLGYCHARFPPVVPNVEICHADIPVDGMLYPCHVPG